MNLEEKAIQRIKLASELSEKYYNAPLICTYSGGKDSDVLLEMFLRSGVKFVCQNSHTTVDAPQTVYHIREVFNRLENMGIETAISYPTYKGKRTSMWEMIRTKGMPTRMFRWCCEICKETSTPNRFIATGVRWDESSKRATRSEFETIQHRAKGVVKATYAEMSEFKSISQERILNHDLAPEKIIEKCKQKKSVVVNPIIDWTEADIWRFIRKNNIKYNPLYDMGYKRVGCIGCPMANYSQRCKEFADFPKFAENYKKAFIQFLARNGNKNKWANIDEAWDWWMETPKMTGQVSLFDEVVEE